MLVDIIKNLQQDGIIYTFLYTSEPYEMVPLSGFHKLERFLISNDSENGSANSTYCDAVCKSKASILEGFLAAYFTDSSFSMISYVTLSRDNEPLVDSLLSGFMENCDHGFRNNEIAFVEPCFVEDPLLVVHYTEVCLFFCFSYLCSLFAYSVTLFSHSLRIYSLCLHILCTYNCFSHSHLLPYTFSFHFHIHKCLIYIPTVIPFLRQ